MSLKIAIIQLAAHDLTEAAIGLQHILDLIEQAAEEYQPDIIITPECSYPAYVLGSEREFLQHYPGDPLPQFKALAARLGVFLCLGLATPMSGEDGLKLYNEAVLIDRQGEIVGRAVKSLLWHFDNKWFCAGEDYPVFDTELGKIGMLICADGRQPEIARSLALAGAQIILDPTCWVTYGADVTALNNPQADYMLATRAFENGVWFVAADKVGIERGTVLYAGRSAVISPTGAKIAEASSNHEQILFAEIPELPAMPRPPVTRRPELYSLLTRATEQLPIHALLQEPLVPAKSTLRGGVLQYLPFVDTQVMGETIRPLVAQMAKESVDLIVLPDVPLGCADEAAWQGDKVFPFYRSLSKMNGLALLATAVERQGERRYKTARLFANGQELGVWQQTHFSTDDEPGWEVAPDAGGVVLLPGGSHARIGVMLGAEGYVPEVARSLMLQGADIILWATRPHLATSAERFDLNHVARSRAAENRVYLLVATPLEETGGILSAMRGKAMIVDANGTIIAPAIAELEMGVSAQLSVSAAREKLRAPGTDVVYSRKPHCYGRLVQSPPW